MHNNQTYGSNYRTHCGGWIHRRQWQSAFQRGTGRAPVNIKENEDSFELFLFAPSLIKENISVATKDDLLTISYTSPKEEERNESNFTRREYHYDSFERSFILNGKVSVDKIVATYKDGILSVLLPKNPDTNKPKQEVPIN